MISAILAPAIPENGPFSLGGIVKVFAYLSFGISFLAVWGSFSAAFFFYPSDELVEEAPTEHATSNAGKD